VEAEVEWNPVEAEEGYALVEGYIAAEEYDPEEAA
jgi:hypothetical protein